MAEWLEHSALVLTINKLSILSMAPKVPGSNTACEREFSKTLSVLPAERHPTSSYTVASTS